MSNPMAGCDIPVFAEDSIQQRLRIGSLNVRREAAMNGYVWGIKLNIPGDWRESAGIYEWRVGSASAREDESAAYIGVATRFADRVPMYWRDMASQLIDAHAGSRSVTRSGTPRYEKSRLRWIHFWLAWAYVHRAPVQLVLRQSASRSFSEEKESIRCAIGAARRLVNREAQGVGKVYVDDVCRLIRSRGDISRVVVPEVWGSDISACPNARPWLEAIDLWQREWSVRRGAA